MEFKVGSAGELGISLDVVCQFYDTHWTRKIALSLPKFYRWQFISAPSAGMQDHCCVAIDDQEKILGVMGLNPRPFILDGVERKGAELTTWVVAAQGLGIGRRMLNFLKERYEVLLGTGITADAIPLYMTSGFRFLKHIPRFVRLYDMRHLKSHCESDALGRKLAASWSPKSEFGGTYKIADVKEAGDFSEFALRSTNHFVRDAAHVAWRYEQHPVLSYQMFMITYGEDKAFVALRIDRLEQFTVAHVLDCICKPAAIPAALQFIDRYCRDNGVHVADFFCISSKVSKWFMAEGWFSTLDDMSLQFAHLFYPVELRQPPTTSLIAWAKQDLHELLDWGNLYLTKSDLDLDRPTQAYYLAHGLVAE